MKKIVIILAVMISILSLQEEKIVIPKETIRFRIIANSNEETDQDLKRKIVNNLQEELKSTENNIDNTRRMIQRNLPTFEEKIREITDTPYTISYGQNYFPKKEYKGVIFPEGEYESLVITLGNGEGDNFWCILFPPLCMIDEEQQEYPSLIKEVLNRFTKHKI